MLLTWEHKVVEYVCCIPRDVWIFCMLQDVASLRCLKSVLMMDLKESKWEWRSSTSIFHNIVKLVERYIVLSLSNMSIMSEGRCSLANCNGASCSSICNEFSWSRKDWFNNFLCGFPAHCSACFSLWISSASHFASLARGFEWEFVHILHKLLFSGCL